MKKLVTICLVICVLLPFAMQGCSGGGGSAVYVDEIPLELTRGSAIDWLSVSSYVSPPEHVWGVAYGYQCELIVAQEVGGMPIPGVKINLDVAGHYAINFGNRLWKDLWDKYGSVIASTPDSRTDEQGKIEWAVVYGNPECVSNPDLNSGLELNPDDSLMSSLVLLEASARKPGGILITSPAYCYFLFEYYEGAWYRWGNTESYLGSPPSALSLVSSLTSTFVLDVLNTADKEVLNRANFLSETNSLPRTSSETYPTTSTGWCQLRKDYGFLQWQNISAFVALWIEPNEPNSAKDLMSSCAPYAYVYDYNQGGVGEANAMTHTAVLNSTDANGNIINRMLIEMHVQSIQQDTARLISNYIVPMEFAEDNGIYFDEWGNKYVAVQILRGGHLEISTLPDEKYGDFNLDDVSSLKDFSLFGEKWETTPLNSDYDFMFDNNRDGVVDWKDLFKFTENYLGE